MGITHPYQPNHAQHPGVLVQEYIEELDISARELARRCGRSPKLISEIIAGKAALEPATALQLESVLELDAQIWLNMEAGYRLNLARREEERKLAPYLPWALSFPLKELAKRGHSITAEDAGTTVRQLLRFFGAASVEACEDRLKELMAVSYRHSPAFDSDEAALLAWLRLGELRADTTDTVPFSRQRFIDALRHIRRLTNLNIEEFVPEIRTRCAAAGVVFVIEQPLSKVALSGVSRWLTPRKALIQQTLRHLSNDHFWFTFFHECAHLLLHSRKFLFIDGNGIASAHPEEEAEANDWAADFLVPQSATTRFITRFNYSESEIRAFAEEQGVAPGIIVGQLQHRKVIGFQHMNHLKHRYQWAS